jgi:hypothetical protein
MKEETTHVIVAKRVYNTMPGLSWVHTEREVWPSDPTEA